MLKAYTTSSLVHMMAYMIDPIAKAYRILFMHSLSYDVVRHCPLNKYTPCDISKKTFLGIMHTKAPKHFVYIYTMTKAK